MKVTDNTVSVSCLFDRRTSLPDSVPEVFNDDSYLDPILSPLLQTVSAWVRIYCKVLKRHVKKIYLATNSAFFAKYSL